MNIILPKGLSILYPSSLDQPRVLELTDNFSAKITDAIVTTVSTSRSMIQVVVSGISGNYMPLFLPPEEKKMNHDSAIFSTS